MNSIFIFIVFSTWCNKTHNRIFFGIVSYSECQYGNGTMINRTDDIGRTSVPLRIHFYDFRSM
ncbi:hypothetical protein HanRHA438_Chr12g0573121 [Helianthus annuus]|nr:hypothetical protein HanRHA438_Chr12g0573121 [Helianthus annuus]